MCLQTYSKKKSLTLWLDQSLYIEIVLQRLRRARFKVNAEKSSLFAPETEYLGYMLTKVDIKAVQKEVQAVLDLHPSPT